MQSNILTVGLYQKFLASFSAYAKKADSGLSIWVATPETVHWLLTHQKFSMLVLDLECLLVERETLLPEILPGSLPVAVLGWDGSLYCRPVEYEADLFLSYDISPPKLLAHILEILRVARDVEGG